MQQLQAQPTTNIFQSDMIINTMKPRSTKRIVVFSPNSRAAPVQIQSPAQRIQQKQIQQYKSQKNEQANHFQNLFHPRDTRDQGATPHNLSHVQSAVRSAYQTQIQVPVSVQAQQMSNGQRRHMMTSHGSRRRPIILKDESNRNNEKFSNHVESPRIQNMNNTQGTIPIFDTNSIGESHQVLINSARGPSTQLTRNLQTTRQTSQPFTQNGPNLEQEQEDDKIRVKNFKPQLPSSRANINDKKRMLVAEYQREVRDSNQIYLQRGIVSSARLYQQTFSPEQRAPANTFKTLETPAGKSGGTLRLDETQIAFREYQRNIQTPQIGHRRVTSQKTSALSGQQNSPQQMLTPPNETNVTIEEIQSPTDILARNAAFKELKPKQQTEVRVSLKITQPDPRPLSPEQNKEIAADAVQTLPSQAEEEVIIFSENHSMDNYVIGKQIGQGAYALVFLGHSKEHDAKVALKIYQKDKIKDLQRKKSIRREIKIMKRINHPNIVKLYDVIETDDQIVLVMEYINGGSTHGFLKSKPNRRMEENVAKRIFGQLMSALNYLHSKCIAHRDIKLENVMLDQNRNVKLIDFGFSTQIPNTQKVKLFCGTPSYMAPEIVLKNEFCGPPADVYASGVLLFAFFCGCFPYRGQNDKDLYNKIATSELILPDYIPQAPRYLLKYMLKKNADERPTSNDLLQDAWVQSGFAVQKDPNFKSRTQHIPSTSRRSNTAGSPIMQAQYLGQTKPGEQRSDIKQQFSPIMTTAIVNSKPKHQAADLTAASPNYTTLSPSNKTPQSSYYTHQVPQTANQLNGRVHQANKSGKPQFNQEAYKAYYQNTTNPQTPSNAHQTINNNITIINNITQIPCAHNGNCNHEAQQVQQNNWTADQQRPGTSAVRNRDQFSPSGISGIRVVRKPTS